MRTTVLALICVWAGAAAFGASPSGVLSGVVVDDHGAPIANALVLYRSVPKITTAPARNLVAAEPLVGASVRTGSDGSFAISGLPAVTYQVCAYGIKDSDLGTCEWLGTTRVDLAPGLSGVNYFFRSATITFPYQRQLLLRRRGAPPPRGRAPTRRAARFSAFERRDRSRSREAGLGKWETCFWFSTFPVRFARAVGMWESRRLWARFPRGSWKGWEACFWLSTLSTAPPFPQLPRPHFCSLPLTDLHSCSAWFSACCFFLASSSR
jgi:hypothetical protein